jgi:hypothetical protein
MTDSTNTIETQKPKGGSVPKHRSSLAVLIESLNLNGLVNYYSPEESLFKKRIDKLNMKFYIETEKILNNGQELDTRYDSLFIILFKQISLYIEEIEKLNTMIREKQGTEKTVKEKLEEVCYIIIP